MEPTLIDENSEEVPLFLEGEGTEKDRMRDCFQEQMQYHSAKTATIQKPHKKRKYRVVWQFSS